MVMATGLPDAFSRKTLFFLKSSVDVIQTCTQCLPGMGVYRVCSRYCNLSYFRFHGRFQVTFCAKRYISQTNFKIELKFIYNAPMDLVNTECAQVMPPVRNMRGLPDEFSRKTLFFLDN